MIRFIRVSLLSLAISVFAISAAQAGTIVADSGFRPNPNGFSFANYGKGHSNLDEAEMQRLFGSSVCVTGKGARCVLTAAARAWMENENESMQGGHCYGFSTLANIIDKGQLPQFGYASIDAFGGGPFAFDLDIEDNPRLQGAIARAFSTQTLPRVVEAGVYGAPAKILDTLIEKLDPATKVSYQMAIFQPGYERGHAITPYAVEDMGGGIYHVHVYDNNWPDDDTRRLIINRNTNHWSYYASQNPDIPAALYEGDAETNTLFLRPTGASLGIQACPFCSGRQGGRSKYTQVTISGGSIQTAHLLITDGKGRKTGFLRGRFVNRIPGARVLHRTSSFRDTLEPIYLIPRKTRFKLRISGHGLTSPVRQTLTMVGPTFDATVDEMLIKPGQVAHATLVPRRQRLTFGATTLDRYPQILFGAQSRKASYRIGFVVGQNLKGTKLAFTKNPRYRLLRISAVKRNPRAFGVFVKRFVANEETDFSRAYMLRGKEQAYLAYGPLARPNGLAKIVIANPKTDKIRVLKVTKNK